MDNRWDEFIAEHEQVQATASMVAREMFEKDKTIDPMSGVIHVEPGRYNSYGIDVAISYRCCRTLQLEYKIYRVFPEMLGYE